MNKIILTSHGAAAQGILDSLSMVSEEEHGLTSVALTHDMGITAFKEKLKKEVETAISESSQYSGVLILADMLGGTPFNVGMELSLLYSNTATISGMNLAMVIVAHSEQKLPLDVLVEVVVATGKESISVFTDGKITEWEEF